VADRCSVQSTRSAPITPAHSVICPTCNTKPPPTIHPHTTQIVSSQCSKPSSFLSQYEEQRNRIPTIRTNSYKHGDRRAVSAVVKAPTGFITFFASNVAGFWQLLFLSVHVITNCDYRNFNWTTAELHKYINIYVCSGRKLSSNLVIRFWRLLKSCACPWIVGTDWCGDNVWGFVLG
jgi:hypothetical protein